MERNGTRWRALNRNGERGREGVTDREKWKEQERGGKGDREME